MSRSRLEGLAYRLLGSVADAEDVVQEARLKLLKQSEPPENEEAWLFRVVTNLALDKLREQKRRRDSYPGPWLPEPFPTAAPDAVAELAENLSMGLVLMLERLSPAERAVFVLREGFDLPFDDIAPLVDATAAACRQRYRRAKSHLAGEGLADAAPAAGPAEQRRLLERLLEAVAERNYESLVALFSEDCVAYTDGGGVVSAAIRPVTDPARIAQVTLFLAEKLAKQGVPSFHWVTLNGGAGVLVTLEDELVLSMQVEVVGDRIRRIYIVRNPHKLAHLSAELE